MVSMDCGNEVTGVFDSKYLYGTVDGKRHAHLIVYCIGGKATRIQATNLHGVFLDIYYYNDKISTINIEGLSEMAMDLAMPLDHPNHAYKDGNEFEL